MDAEPPGDQREIPLFRPLLWTGQCVTGVVTLLLWGLAVVFFSKSIASIMIVHIRSSVIRSKAGYLVAKYDKLRADGRAMDFTTPPGILFLGSGFLHAAWFPPFGGSIFVC